MTLVCEIRSDQRHQMSLVFMSRYAKQQQFDTGLANVGKT